MPARNLASKATQYTFAEQKRTMQDAVQQLPNRMIGLRPILLLNLPQGHAPIPIAKEEAPACTR